MSKQQADHQRNMARRQVGIKPSTPKARTLAEQHATIREEQPVTPQAAISGPTRIAQDELVDLIKAGEFFGGTFRIDSTHTDTHLVRKDLDSARSRISRYAKKAGLEYSSQQLYDAEGDRYLAIHISLG